MGTPAEAQSCLIYGGGRHRTDLVACYGKALGRGPVDI